MSAPVFSSFTFEAYKQLALQYPGCFTFNYAKQGTSSGHNDSKSSATSTEEKTTRVATPIPITPTSTASSKSTPNPSPAALHAQSYGGASLFGDTVLCADGSIIQPDGTRIAADGTIIPDK